MKRKLSTLVILLIISGLTFNLISFTVFAEPESQNKSKKKLILGVSPYAGEEYFIYNGKNEGYLIDLVEKIEKELNIEIEIKRILWSDMLPSLKSGKIDIVLGANESPERKKWMSFTEPIRRVPYAIFTLKDSNIYNVTDLNEKKVAFLDGDIGINLMKSKYLKISYSTIKVRTPEEAFDLINKGMADAFIDSAGELAYDFLYKYKNMKMASEISVITSDYTLSSRKKDEKLLKMINEVLVKAKQTNLADMINDANIKYIRKAIELSKAESEWLEDVGVIRVGIVNNYLPFNYIKNNKYLGINGFIIEDITKKLGIEMVINEGCAETLLNRLVNGDIDLVCTSKIDVGKKNLILEQPFYFEKDMIFGKLNSPEVFDTEGLEGKRIAVVSGYHQKDMLLMTLSNPNIIYTENIKESIKLLEEGKADYLIETPIIVRYYMQEMGISNLVEKGQSNFNSFSYTAFSNKSKTIATIFRKIVPLMDISKGVKEGYQSVPHNVFVDGKSKIELYIGLVAVIVVFILVSLYLMCAGASKKKERRRFADKSDRHTYVDSLTGLLNRNYFRELIKPTIDKKDFPQALIVIDMNNLKDINDNHGHLGGDMALQKIAEILKTLSTEIEDSLVFRFGGDEFVLLLYKKNKSQAENVLGIINNLCEKQKVVFPTGEEISVSAAIGLSIREDSTISFEELFREADRNMYKDKRNKKT